MKLYSGIVLALTLYIAFVQPIQAQEVWEREWKGWKSEDAYKILSNSPWAKNCTNKDASLPCGANSNARFERGEQSIAQISAPIIVRLHSSPKIRQAWLRLKQIQAKYDDFDNQRKSEFDKSSENDLICDVCKTHYVIQLYQTVVQENNDSSIFNKKLREGEIKTLADQIYLINDKGEKRKLTQIKINKEKAYVAELHFQILDEQQNALITNQTKNVVLNFKKNFWREGSLKEVKFDISKMLINGKLDF